MLAVGWRDLAASRTHTNRIIAITPSNDSIEGCLLTGFQGLMSGLGGRASPGGTVAGTEEDQAASPASSSGSTEAASLPGQLPLSPLTYGDGAHPHVHL